MHHRHHRPKHRPSTSRNPIPILIQLPAVRRNHFRHRRTLASSTLLTTTHQSTEPIPDRVLRARVFQLIEFPLKVNRIPIKHTVIRVTHNRHPTPRLDRFNRERLVHRLKTRSDKPILIHPHQQINIPIHMPKRRDVLHQRDPPAVLPHPLKHALNRVPQRPLLRQRFNPHRRPKHKVHHRPDAPSNIILDHHLAPPARCAHPIHACPRHASGKPQLLRHPVPTSLIRTRNGPAPPDELEWVAVIRPQLLKSGQHPVLVRIDQRSHKLPSPLSIPRQPTRTQIRHVPPPLPGMHPFARSPNGSFGHQRAHKDSHPTTTTAHKPLKTKAQNFLEFPVFSDQYPTNCAHKNSTAKSAASSITKAHDQPDLGAMV